MDVLYLLPSLYVSGAVYRPIVLVSHMYLYSSCSMTYITCNTQVLP